MTIPREHFGRLREAVHTNDGPRIANCICVAKSNKYLWSAVWYIHSASRMEPYCSAEEWFGDGAAKEICYLCSYYSAVRESEYLCQLAYLIMSSEWCDEWLAFAIDVLGHIDVGTVNLGDALHWWCGHWRVLHQRILDAGWECEPRHVWYVLSIMVGRCWQSNIVTEVSMWSANSPVFYSYPVGEYEWDTYQSNNPNDHHNRSDWWFNVLNCLSSPIVCEASGPFAFYAALDSAQRIRGHK